MNLRETLTAINKELEEKNKQEEEIWKSLADLSKEKDRLLAQIAFEEKMLYGDWIFQYQDSFYGCSFKLLLKGDINNLPEFKALYDPDYHQQFPLEWDESYSTVELWCDDEDVRLKFNSDEIGLKFIEKWNLTISLEEVEASLERAKTFLNTTQNLKSKFSKLAERNTE